MTPEQLRIFLAVADRAHVTRAAEALGLTQSAVSAALATLERAHDVQLFDRIGRRIVLTAEGAAFVPEARAALDRLETARAVLDDLGARPQGVLRIWASQTVASYWLPALLVRFRVTHPQVRLRLDVGNTAQVAGAVRAGAADLGFVEGAVSEGELRARAVARDRLVLVGPAGLPLPTGAALAQARWILREEGSGTRSVALAALDRLGLDTAALDVVLELPSNEAVLAAVAAGGGISALSERVAAHATASGAVTLAPLPGAERPFTALSHPERHRTRAMAAFLELAG